MKQLPLAAVLLVAVAANASAAFEKGSQTINLNLGMGIPLTDLDLSAAGGGKDKVGTPGISVGGQYLYHVAPRLGLGLDINYSKSGEKQSSKFSPLLDSMVKSESVVALVIGKFIFIPNGKASPYVLAGGGVHSSRLKFSASPAAGLVWADTGTRESRVFGDSSGTNYAIVGGLGIDVFVTENAFLGLEGRYQHLGSDAYESTSLGQAAGVSGVRGEASMVNIHARAGYRF